MPPAVWKGAIAFGLVQVPVALYPASQENEVDFDWLDRRSMDPVGYKRLRYPLALMLSNHGVGHLIDVLAYAEHMKLHASFRSDSVAALKRCVRSTDGVSFIGAGVAVAAEVDAGELITLDLAHPLSRKAKARLVVRKGRPLAGAAAHLLGEIRHRFSMFRAG